MSLANNLPANAADLVKAVHGPDNGQRSLPRQEVVRGGGCPQGSTRDPPKDPPKGPPENPHGVLAAPNAPRRWGDSQRLASDAATKSPPKSWNVRVGRTIRCEVETSINVHNKWCVLAVKCGHAANSSSVCLLCARQSRVRRLTHQCVKPLTCVA